MKKIRSILGTLAATALLIVWEVGTTHATVVQTFGPGSAVSTLGALANFESADALFDNPYLEDGLSFSRTALTFDNNGCGFAGVNCIAGFSGFAGFTGNFMHGAGSGFFTMQTTFGNFFTGLEFVVGTGIGFPTEFSWSAEREGAAVGSGVFVAGSPIVVGFVDALGFDTLNFSEIGTGNLNPSPAFDQVRAELAFIQPPAVIPLPAALPLYGTGLAVMGFLGWRRKRRAAAGITDS